MKTRCLALAAALLLALAAGAGAATTDIRPLRLTVTRAVSPSTCTNDPPVEENVVCLEVVVQNLGPDPYVGTEPSKASRTALAGKLKISVDIDEPSKPTPWPVVQKVNFTQEFAVTIAAGDSATLDFGVVGWKPAAGTHNATTTAIAQAPNNDPNPANNTITSVFQVYAVTPAVERTGVLVLGLGLVAAAAWGLARRARARA